MKAQPVVASLIVLLWAAPGSAAVFANQYAWPQSNHVTDVNVCIVDGSSVDQKSQSCSGCIHDANPSLNEVVYQIEHALESGWSRTGSVRFHDWRMCSALTPNEQSRTIGFYIHPDADNVTLRQGVSGQGKVTASDYAVSIKPWGRDTTCINYNWNTTHEEYSFDCARQYAIHEFGHVLGFEHEMWNPSPTVPAGCHDADNPALGPLSYDTTYPNQSPYTLFNPGFYDWDSIMAYNINGTTCASVKGVRFGSPTLDPTDEAAFRAVYQAPETDVPVVYSDGGFTGNAMPLYSTWYDAPTLKAVGNDTISSLRVPPGWSVWLFADNGFGGSYRQYTQDTPWVGDFNDLTSSVVALSPPGQVPSAPVYVYEHGGGDGRYQVLWAPAGGGTRTYDLNQLTMGNDIISSLKFGGLGARTQVTLWEHGGCVGRSRTFVSDPSDWYSPVINLDAGFNDVTSCIQVSSY